MKISSDIPYGRQTVSEEDIKSVEAVLRSDFLTQGPRVEEFEEAVAERVEARHAVAFSSATAALHGAAWVASQEGFRRPVVPDLTFIATFNAPAYVGLKPHIADVDDSTWNLDFATVPRRADLLLPVHFAGLPVDLRGMPNRIARKSCFVIEDASHALGATTPYGPVGNNFFSDLTCFSFHPVKPITTGEGGMVTTNDESFRDALREFRSHGIVRTPSAGAWTYDVRTLGFNYRMSDLHAALGLSQLSRLDSFLKVREHISERYRQQLAGLPLRFQSIDQEGFSSANHLFAVRLADRNRVYREMHDQGIRVQVHYVPLSSHSRVRDVSSRPKTPRSQRIYEEILSLPIHPSLTAAEQTRVIDALKRALGQ